MDTLALPEAPDVPKQRLPMIAILLVLNVFHFLATTVAKELNRQFSVPNRATEMLGLGRTRVHEIWNGVMHHSGHRTVTYTAHCPLTPPPPSTPSAPPTPRRPPRPLFRSDPQPMRSRGEIARCP